MLKGSHALYTMKYETYLKILFWIVLCKCCLQIKHRKQCSIQAMFSSMEGNTVGGGGVFVLYFCWFCHGQWKVCGLFLFIFNWRIFALQYCIGLYQTSIWVSHRVSNFISVCPILPEGKHWRNWFICLGAQSIPLLWWLYYTANHQQQVRGQGPQRILQVPSGHSWAQLTCPADLLLLLLAHLTEAHLCAFTASTECVPSDWGKQSGYCLKGIYFRKGRWGILGLLIKSGPRWCCWWQAGLFSVLINQQLCQRPVPCLCFKLIWVLKWLLLGSWVHQSPTSADICCCLVRRRLTVSAYLGRQANFQWNWKEMHSQGHHACPHHIVAISAFAKKKTH